MSEMILQSHDQEIHLLPALPTAWQAGSVQGLCARNGFEVDIEWKENALIRATIRSGNGELCRLRTSVPVQVKGVQVNAERTETEWGTWYLTVFPTK